MTYNSLRIAQLLLLHVSQKKVHMYILHYIVTMLFGFFEISLQIDKWQTEFLRSKLAKNWLKLA